MENGQELEWLKAQKIVVSVDLVDVAKTQLKFLAAVDRNRCLYDGPVLHRAIFRYKTYWLPLLAKCVESKFSEGPLVVPLDCEWIWHCHRLNPVRYKADCEEFYGRILDNKNVLSTVHGACKKETEKIWNRLFPEEPYELDLNSYLSEDVSQKFLSLLGSTTYNLVAAVKRQSSFFYQVSRPSMNDDCFLEGALARYKGFLYLIKRNKERSIRRFCVPTYDIDLMWHSHQLNPASYCKDMVEALGKVLEHDDTDSDRTKGQKLDVGFSGTTKQWESTFGSRYWRAGSMYRGTSPSPVSLQPWPTKAMNKKLPPSCNSPTIIQLPKINVVEVLLEIVGIKDLPQGHNRNLFVVCSKSMPDAFFKARRRLSIFSESGEKQVAAFQCEFSGELLFELMSHSPSTLPISRPAKSIGRTAISLHDLLDTASNLSLEKWFELVPTSNSLNFNPICLRIAVSITVPSPAPYLLQMIQSHPFLRKSCFTPLPKSIQPGKSYTCVVDEDGEEIMSIQMRNTKKSESGNKCISKKEVIGVIGCSSETHVLAEFRELGWLLMDSNWSYQLQKKSTKDGHIFELIGSQMLRLFQGRKLEYESRNCHKQKVDRYFITVVEFSADYPYGNAIALLNLKSGLIEVKEEWFLLHGITLTFILSDLLKKEGYNLFFANEENTNTASLSEEINNDCDIEDKSIKSMNSMTKEAEMESAKKASEKGENENFGNVVRSGACGACGGGCGGSSMVTGGGCGGCGAGGCGGGCGGGNMVKSGGCGGCGAGGCGGGCSGGNMVKSGGCGGCGAGGCGGGCGGGNMVNSGGCGGCGAGGCGGGCGGGNKIKSGGCGGGGCGGCGGGCGGDNMVNSG